LNKRTNNFPQNGRGLGHVTPKIERIFKITWAGDFKFGM